ncbi:hypothetical protein [Streptomyces europaeiscabiei]|uniref:hypothetical protein n=1 Tax=Streptomyces europaeiscabiei TaxID=146819 RepID=UPI002E2B95DD|nr:hypothetical protein [Streptomyces europaeiscabiei]
MRRTGPHRQGEQPAARQVSGRETPTGIRQLALGTAAVLRVALAAITIQVWIANLKGR